VSTGSFGQAKANPTRERGDLYTYPRRFPVETILILFHPILPDALWAFSLRPLRELFPFTRVLKEWHSITARSVDEINLNVHNLTRSGVRREQGDEFTPRGVSWMNGSAFAI